MSVRFNVLNGIAFVDVFVILLVVGLFLVVYCHYSCYCSQLLIRYTLRQSRWQWKGFPY